MLLDSAKLDLTRATSDRERVTALTRIAVYQARRGEVDLAERTIASMRSQPTSGPYTLAIAGANLAEGVLAFCDVNFVEAADKIKRAIAMAKAARDDRLKRWCEAWSAHLSFHFGRIEDLCIAAQEILGSADADEHSAISRIASTLATACHDANRFDIARQWYGIARRHAVAEGDDLTIDATLHNLAANHIVNLRLASLETKIDATELAQASLELQSSINYDKAKDPQSFRWMLPLLQIHLSILREDWGIAENLTLAWLEGFEDVAPSRVVSVAYADLGLCLASFGRIEAAMDNVSKAASSLPGQAALDDLAIAYSQCAKTARACTQPVKAEEFEAMASHALAQLREAQARNERLLREVRLPTRYGNL